MFVAAFFPVITLMWACKIASDDPKSVARLNLTQEIKTVSFNSWFCNGSVAWTPCANPYEQSDLVWKFFFARQPLFCGMALMDEAVVCKFRCRNSRSRVAKIGDSTFQHQLSWSLLLKNGCSKRVEKDPIQNGSHNLVSGIDSSTLWRFRFKPCHTFCDTLESAVSKTPFFTGFGG